MNKILQELNDRGMLANISDEKKFEEAIKKGKGVYVGFDPTFVSLHLGNFAMIRVLQIFKKHGVKILPVIGGATGQIGDPSGKNSERILLDSKIIEENILSITKQILKLTNSDKVVNNIVFYQNMSVFEYLKEIGKNFNIGYLISKDTIKNRLETGISYTEFSYNLIQAYDWFMLNKQYNIGIQCGGSDQWGNITSGLEFIRKKMGVDEIVSGVTIQLLTKTDGTKFGKSEKGAIFLDKEITPVYDMYQFLFNQRDEDLEKLLMFLTNYEIKEIKEIIVEHKQNPALRIGQRKLCQNVIEQIHGLAEYENALKLTKLLFEQKYHEISLEDFKNVFMKSPTYKINKLNCSFVDLLIDTKIISSKRIARELIASKSITVNGILIDENSIIDSKKLLHEKYLILKKGKKNFYVLEI